MEDICKGLLCFYVLNYIYCTKKRMKPQSAYKKKEVES
jgi:hypothetical protein